MNRNQNERNRNLEKHIPGCLGRMVNLFDLNTNVGGNRLLTDKPYYEGFPVSRSQSDVSRTRLVDDQMNDKVIVSELGKSPSNRKSNGAPIKMLIAQEMSKEEGPKQSPPNLVAKLMGLDTLPQQYQLGSALCRSNHRRSRSHSGSWDILQKDHGFLDQEQGEYKDVFEIWNHSCKTYGDSPQKGRYKESKNEKNMALVREKFMEAKRLSTDEKLRQSKQFQDALEVLSSNKDLFLKLLQEPNSLFSQQNNLQSVRPPPESRRITILKPSQLVDGHKLTGLGKKNGKQINKTLLSPDCYKFASNPTQKTPIVVLKPSFGKPHEVKVVPSSPSSLRTSNDDGFYGDPEDSEAPESRKVPEESTLCMSESHRRDEALLSLVFSNGYIGDESSFSKSEVYYASGNLSDSEVMSPTSRHSWDYINRFGSPYSSSFSRASYSPESSVCREAKKRLSERWEMMALNGNVQEQKYIHRSSSTLGEMLALSDLKKSVDTEEHFKNGEASKGSSSPKNLPRSTSVPVSSTVSGSRHGEVSEFLKGKKDDYKDSTKEKGLKSSSFKGKVSSLFFSRSRKSSKQKPDKFDDEHQSANIGTDESRCINDVGEFPVTKPETSGNANDNQDQPSPISVLELQFEDDEHTKGFSRNLTDHGVDPMKFNLIDKSPPIGSIARTLSWDDSAVGPGKTSTAPMNPEEEEQECFLYFQTLLAAAGIDDEVQPESWYSPECPLDPSLRENYMSLTEKDPPLVHHTKQRHHRSTQKLVFDCVNEALIDITGHIPCNGPNKSILADHVWVHIKEWISGVERCISDGEDGGTLVVRKKVAGQVWLEHLRLEVENIKKEIEEKLLEELVQESVLELMTGIE